MNSSSSSLRGFRFYPTEEELVSFYLRNKLENRRKDIERVIPVLDVYNFEPWQLPQQSGEPCARDSEQWFFFCPMQVREAQGGRPNRTTPSGYWKATGSPILVYPVNGRARGPIGVKKTMVFYKGKTPHGTKTKWKMNEYKALADIDQNSSTASTITTSSLRTCNDFSLCRVYVRTGCLRSFDRRPRASTSTTPAGPQGNCPLPPAVEPCSSEKMTATASRESSSSSGDHGVNGGDADWIIPEGVDWDFLDSI